MRNRMDFQTSNTRNMLIKTFLKTFLKHRITNLLSVGGLSLGMAIALLLGWWALNEMKFDRFHTDTDKIFRVCREGYINNETIKIGSVFGPVSREAKLRFPQVEESIRVITTGKRRFNVGEVISYEESIYFADTNFFQFFNFPVKSGDINSCFKDPDKIVLTESFAAKYFGDKNPIGETVNVYDRDWQISAVMYNIPNNSHLQFDAICVLSGVPNLDNSGWGNRDGFATYIKIVENTDTEDLAKSITSMARENFPPYTQVDISHFLQPLKDIHFNTEHFRFDYAVKSDKRFVMIFLFMAIAILVIACINFTNLFISTSFLRSKSIGLKKANGASKGSLIKEFFTETSLYVLLSAIAGIAIASLFLPMFNQLANANIVFDFSNVTLCSLLLGITLLTIIMAGTFPALYLTKFNPAATLKGEFNGKNVSVLQKGLVIFQFAASIVLLVTVVSIKRQVHFVQSADLGFNKSNVVYVDASGAFSESYETVKQELERNHEIVEVTAKNCIPSDWNQGMGVSSHETRDNPYVMEICGIKNNYLDMMGIRIVEGENISIYHDSLNYVMINEQAASALGFDYPIDETIYQGDEPLIVKGVLQDIKTKSLHNRVDPQVYRKLRRVESGNVLMIRISDNTQSAIKAIKEKWQEVNPEHPFEYHFLDDTYDGLYQNEIRAGRIVTWGMSIALFITMIGLFAMARYSTERRTKEIGLRKVNGAELFDILILLNKDFLKWVIIAFIVSIPISWYLVNSWLNSFAYRTGLSWWIFALAGVIAVFISLATVSWQTFLAATRNPVEALRYE
jgi:putative ABC transport system permease protein